MKSLRDLDYINANLDFNIVSDSPRQIFDFYYDISFLKLEVHHGESSTYVSILEILKQGCLSYPTFVSHGESST